MPLVTLLHLQHPWLLHLQSSHPWHPQHPQWHQATTPVYLGTYASILITPKKWVINLSSAPHISTRNTIGKRPQLCNSPKVPHQGILLHSSGRSLFQTLSREADELRSDISHILKNPNHNNKTNLTIQEHKALTELKQETSKVILTADKG